MIRGKKVYLRPVEERDLPVIVRWRNEPSNRRLFFSPALINPGGQNKWYEDLLADRNRLLFMFDTLEGRTVGMAGLNHIDWRNQECEGGQFLLDPEERGQGYAEEAAFLVLHFAFNELNLRRIYAYCYAFNPVIDFMKSLGFKEEGVLRQAAFTQGKFHDKVVIAVLRDEWRGEWLDEEMDD